MMTSEDLILIFYIWVRKTTIEGTKKKIQFKQHFATTFTRLTQKIMILAYMNTFSVYLTMLVPSFPPIETCVLWI